MSFSETKKIFLPKPYTKEEKELLKNHFGFVPSIKRKVRWENAFEFAQRFNGRNDRRTELSLNDACLILQNLSEALSRLTRKAATKNDLDLFKMGFPADDMIVASTQRLLRGNEKKMLWFDRELLGLACTTARDSYIAVSNHLTTLAGRHVVAV